ncbi:MAG: hypothetical protein WA144_10925, partial [Candidatus Methanoperedens sp.]
MPIKNDKHLKNTHFLRDDSARVPFAIIGIFLVILSTLVSLNLNRMDIKMAKTMSSNARVKQRSFDLHLLIKLHERISRM